MIFAIDPGDVYSAYVIVEDDFSKVLDKGKVLNNELMFIINDFCINQKMNGNNPAVAIEMIASYGMPVGATTFETCVWIGRFIQIFYQHGYVAQKIYRKDEKMVLCGSMKAKDANIRQALIDRYGVVGTKKSPGYFYGFKADIWAAMAVAVTYHDRYKLAEPW